MRHPHRHFERYLGPQKNLYSGEAFELTRAHIEDLAALDTAAITRPERYWLFVETADEVLGRVLDLSKAEVVRNGDWFAKMSFAELLELCGKVTVAQLLTRDDFAKRMQSESPIFLHECLYPVMQAWDSVMVRADVETG